MPRRRSERGEGNLGCILWMLALGLVTLIAWKAVPAKIQSTQLYDFMDEKAKEQGSTRRPPEEIAKVIVERARQLEIPLDRQDVHVTQDGDRIFMEVEYTIPLEFPGYTYKWHFHQKLDRPIFIV